MMYKYLTKKQRLDGYVFIYLCLLSAEKKEDVFMCMFTSDWVDNELGTCSYFEEGGSCFPEMMSHQPIGLKDPTVGWFRNYNKAPRLRVIEHAIAACELTN